MYNNNNDINEIFVRKGVEISCRRKNYKGPGKTPSSISCMGQSEG